MGELHPNDLWTVSLAYARVLQEFVFFAVTSVTNGRALRQHHNDFGAFTEE